MIKVVLRTLFFLAVLFGVIYPFAVKKDVTGEQPQAGNKPAAPVKIEEKPLHNVALPDFAAMRSVKEKKKLFFDFLRPHVERNNKRILQHRATLEIALMMRQFGEELSDKQRDTIANIFSQYKMAGAEINIESLNRALKRVDVIPKELVLMQAANESAWGTSRFARIGLNFFGQWCYSKGCGMVPGERDGDASHEVKAYKTVEQAVDAYFRNINTNNAYRELRDIRASLRRAQQPVTAEALSAGLMSYSERGEAYVAELNEMIDHNRSYFE